MPEKRVFKGHEAVSSKQGVAYMNVDGQNRELFYAKSVEATLTKNKEEIRALGSRMVGYKTTSVQGAGTLVIYHVTSFFKEQFIRYVNEGIDIYFSLNLINEDPSTNYGRESIVLTDCNLDEITIATFDSEDGVMESEMPFTFEGVELLESYSGS